MSQYWFRPHAYGYGATLANWKGCAAVAGFIAVILSLVLSTLVLPPDLPDGPGAWQVSTCAAMVAALTLWFIRFCRKRTDGHWAWRWRKQR